MHPGTRKLLHNRFVDPLDTVKPDLDQDKITAWPPHSLMLTKVEVGSGHVNILVFWVLSTQTVSKIHTKNLRILLSSINFIKGHGSVW